MIELMPHQKEAVDHFFKRNGRLLVWGDVGIGKALVAITIARQTLAEGSVLYFCPAILKEQVKNEFTKFAPDVSVFIVSGNKQQREKIWKSGKAVYIVNPEQLLTDLAYMCGHDTTVILDESHLFNSPTSKRIKRLWKLNPKYRCAMSGTPFPNALYECYNLLKWIKPSSVQDTWWAFRASECKMNPYFPAITGLYNEEKIRQKIADVSIRIRREDVLQLPPLEEKRLTCEMEPKHKKAYEDLRKDMVVEVASNEFLTVPNALSLLTRLRQMVDCPRLLGFDYQSSKELLLKQLLETIISKKIIVFCEYAQVLEYLAKQYKSHLITGKTSQKDRIEILEKFKNDDIRLLFMSSAGAYGINCQHVSVIIHFSLPLTDSRVEQRNGRAWRYGQDKVVTSYRLIVKDSVDEKIEKLIAKKRKLNKDDILKCLKNT